MINLFKVKEKQKIAEKANGGKLPVKKQSAGELRLHKGICLTYCENISIYISKISSLRHQMIAKRYLCPVKVCEAVFNYWPRPNRKRT